MNKHEYLSVSLRAALAELDVQTDPHVLADMLKQQLKQFFTLHSIWQYRPYFNKLPKEEILRSKTLITAAASIAVMEGKLTKASALFDMLPKDSPYYIYAQFMFPLTSWQDFISCVTRIQAQGLSAIPNLTITAGRPFVLNGFRDFSPTLKEIYDRSEDSVTLFQQMYGERSKNAITIALAESEYLQDDCFSALTKIVGILPYLTTETDAQLLFPALYFQMLILIMTGQVSAIEPMVRNLRSQLHTANRDEWLPNVDAMEAHSALYGGDYAKVALWMRNCAPDEYNDFCMLDLYRYMVKLRIYIVQQKNLAFKVLASKLLPLLQQSNRRMDECELQTLCAICDYTCSDKDSALSHISRALELAETYRYDRLLADEGEQLLRVLMFYRREKGSTPYLNRIIALTRKTASYYPRYLKVQLPETSALSDAELVVLRFLADGRSNADIAELLDVQLDTVKAHCKHIAKKLQTKNRHQAVTRAIELGILDPANPGTPFPALLQD